MRKFALLSGAFAPELFLGRAHYGDADLAALAMLFYFQFLAMRVASGGGQNPGEMVVHALIHADHVDAAAERVTTSMRSVYLKIGDIRRAFAVRTAEELGKDRRLLSLSKQVERSRHAYLFEFPNGTEVLCGPSLEQLKAARPTAGSNLPLPPGLRVEVNGQN